MDRPPSPSKRFELTGEVVGRTKEGRPLIRNNQGSVSSELSITVRDPRDPKRFINIPSIFEGRIVSELEALDIISNNGFKDPETGRGIESFSNLSKAVNSAKARSSSIETDDETKGKRIFND